MSNRIEFSLETTLGLDLPSSGVSLKNLERGTYSFRILKEFQDKNLERGTFSGYESRKSFRIWILKQTQDQNIERVSGSHFESVSGWESWKGVSLKNLERATYSFRIKFWKSFRISQNQKENLSDASTKAGVRVGLLEEVFDQGGSTFLWWVIILKHLFVANDFGLTRIIQQKAR